jgi:hypothetical protein
MTNILPTVDQVLNHRNWTGLSLRELVEAGRVKPHEGDKWIETILTERWKAGGEIVPHDESKAFLEALSGLECDVLEALCGLE